MTTPTASVFLAFLIFSDTVFSKPKLPGHKNGVKRGAVKATSLRMGIPSVNKKSIT